VINSIAILSSGEYASNKTDNGIIPAVEENSR
jgi:hypothetical protein